MREGRLSSRDNPRIKLYRSLDDREAREASGLMAAEGVRLVEEALASALPVPELFLSDALEPEARKGLLRALERRARGGWNTAVHALPEKLFRSMAHTRNPQGAAATVSLPCRHIMPGSRGLRKVAVLNRPQDPGNVGTIMRTVEAADFDALAVVEPACDPYGPKAARASMGSVFRVRVLRETDAGEAAARFRAEGLRLLAADPRARRSLYRIDAAPPLAVFFGGETAGLPAGLKAQSFSLPMGGWVESLNLAMAVSVVLYEIRRRELAMPRWVPGERRE